MSGPSQPSEGSGDHQQHGATEEPLERASDEANVDVGGAKSTESGGVNMADFDNDPCFEVSIRNVYAKLKPDMLPQLPELFEKYKRLPGGLSSMHSKVINKYLLDDSDH